MSKKMQIRKMVVIGSSNVDFIMKLPRLPKVGESVTNGKFMQTYGGKGANQAVAAARAGGDVWFINCVGDDSWGPRIKQNMVDAGIHTDFMWALKGYSSGKAVVLIGRHGRNLPTIDPGANHAITPEMLLSVKDQLQDAAVFVLQYEMPAETLYMALEIAKEFDIPVVFNFAPPQPIDKKKIDGVDYLIVNETEAEFLLGYPLVNHESMQKAAQELLALGAKTVMITLGHKGVYVACESCNRIVPAYPVEAVDTTAAGDTFCGAFATALTEGKSVLEAIYFANAAAALCVTQLGAQPSIPTREVIDSFIQQHSGE